MNIVQAAHDENLFKPYLQGNAKDLASWQPWLTCLRVIFGVKLRKSEHDLVRRCTGRDPIRLPRDGFRTVLLLCGRRSGKSKIAGLIAAHESLLSGREKVCSPGELPMVSVVAPTRDQSEIIRSYTRAALQGKVLASEIVDDLKQSLTLSNGVRVRSLTGSFTSVRGYTQLAVIIDEVCFFTVGNDECRVKSDTELIRAITPALLTTKGPLIAVSTKYAPRGWAYKTWRNCFANDAARTLVWDATSRTMNPTLDQADIDAAIAEDPAAARAEFMNEWREDVESFLPDSAIRACVVEGRLMLVPKPKVRYFGFCDVSGGKRDSAALCIGHKQDRTVIIDFLKEYKAPFSPYSVAGKMAKELRKFRLTRAVGDRYAAEFSVQAFKSHGISYRPSEKNKSELYLELIGPVCSREIELLDNERLVSQLASLERRTRSGGRDSVDHAPGQHDDIANVVAGCASLTGKRQPFVGVIKTR